MSILEEIAEKRRERVARAKARVSEETFLRGVEDAPPARSLTRAILGQKGAAIIAEYKIASPSAGTIREDLTPEDAAGAYEAGGAAAISVITEPDFFRGEGGFLARARNACSLPVLRKDFILEPFQVLESRALHADAILLICALLGPGELSGLMREARQLGMECLVEVHHEEELDRALAAGAGLIGINNRNLKTFEVSLDTTPRLMARVPGGVTVVAESGIRTRDDIAMLYLAGARGFLIGETLMRAPDPGAKLKELLGGG